MRLKDWGVVWRKVGAKETGTFTIEASLVMPAILLCTLCFLMLALLVYRQCIMYQQAALTADRLAYVWDNSHKDPISGAFAVEARDGLYWRLTQDRAFGVDAIFSDEPSVTVSLPKETSQLEEGLAERKLYRASNLLTGVRQARLSYSNKLLIRSIGVGLSDPFHSTGELGRPVGSEGSGWPGWPGLPHGLKFPETIAESAKSNVVDPVEFIRTIDFVQSSAAKLLNLLSPGEAGELLDRTASLSPSDALKFSGHDIDAAPYLRQLVNGRTEDYDSRFGVRHIDALDKSGVAHQAYCTFNTSNLADVQLPKDAELLKKGAVKGVVWHFFTNCRGEQSKPSQKLLKRLRESGIVAVVHN
jgi:hypothetical protein